MHQSHQKPHPQQTTPDPHGNADNIIGAPPRTEVQDRRAPTVANASKVKENNHTSFKKTRQFLNEATATPGQNLVSGALAGSLSRTITSPLATVKTLMQLETHQVEKGIKGQYRGMNSSFSRLYAEEGARAFWKGNGVAILRLAPYTAVKFSCFERFNSLLAGKVSYGLQPTIAGSLAGMVAITATYPLDLIKVRMTVQNMKKRSYVSVMSALKSILKEEGVRGLYRGVPVAVVGVIPYEGTKFLVYSVLKDVTKKYRIETGRVSKLSIFHYMGIGGVAGVAASAAAYPFDSIRKRLQAQHFQHLSFSASTSSFPRVAASPKSGAEASPHWNQGKTSGAAGGEAGQATAVLPRGKKYTAYQYSGMIDAGRKIMKTEGWKGLYRGSMPSRIRALPYTAIMFAIYEELTRFFVQWNEMM